MWEKRTQSLMFLHATCESLIYSCEYVLSAQWLSFNSEVMCLVFHARLKQCFDEENVPSYNSVLLLLYLFRSAWADRNVAEGWLVIKFDLTGPKKLSSKCYRKLELSLCTVWDGRAGKRGRDLLKKGTFCLLTDPHTDGCQTPAGPVHHVEEEETCHRDEVCFCSKTSCC